MFSRGTIRPGMRPKVDMQRFKTFRGLRDDFSQLDLKKNLFENSQIRVLAMTFRNDTKDKIHKEIIKAKLMLNVH